MELRRRGWLPAAEGSEPEPAGGGGVGAPRSAALSVSLAPEVAVSPSPCQSRLEAPSLLSSLDWGEQGCTVPGRRGGARSPTERCRANLTSCPGRKVCVFFLTPPGL